MQQPRLDGRKANQVRPYNLSQNLLNNSDGSSLFSSGEHNLICGVFGPVEIKHKDEVLGEAYVEVNYKPAIGIPGPNSKLIERAVRTTFDSVILKALHPRSMIQINLQPQNQDGEPISLAINATMAALLNASLPLNSLIVACSCAITNSGEILLDPLSSEIKTSASVHSFAFLNKIEDPKSSPLIFSESVGVYSLDQFLECHSLCLEAAIPTFAFLRESISSKLY